jgi:hypothetical protein
MLVSLKLMFKCCPAPKPSEDIGKRFIKRTIMCLTRLASAKEILNFNLSNNYLFF